MVCRFVVDWLGENRRNTEMEITKGECSNEVRAVVRGIR